MNPLFFMFQGVKWKFGEALANSICVFFFFSTRQFKKRAPHAVKAIKAFAQKTMGTADVRLDPSLNKAVWSHGIKKVPHRIRVRIARKRNDDEDAKEKLYSYVSFVPVTSFKGKSSWLWRLWTFECMVKLYSFTNLDFFFFAHRLGDRCCRWRVNAF